MILNIRTVDYLAKAPNSSFITTLLLLRFEACFFATILSRSAEFSSLSGY